MPTPIPSRAPSPSGPTGPSSTRRLGLAALVVALIAAIASFAWIRGRAEPSPPAPEPGTEVATKTGGPTGAAARGPQGSEADASASLAGQVRDPDGQAISGALVTLVRLDSDPLGPDDSRAGEPTTARTRPEGSFALTGLAPGRYAISASAPGYRSTLGPELVLARGQARTEVELRLSPGGVELRGTVSDKTGGTIEGALVRVTPQAGISSLRERESVFALSDDQGRYVIAVGPGRHRIEASHPDYSPEARVLELGQTVAAQDFALIPTAVIEGVVVRDADGSPVAHAELRWAKQRLAYLPGGEAMTLRDRGGLVRTDAEGRFRLSGLPAGLIELTARASGLASLDPVEVPVGLAERSAGVELRLVGASDVEGRVVAHASSEGLADAHVELLSPTGDPVEAQTDAEGHFRLLGVLPGRYQAIARADGYAGLAGPPPSVEVGGRPSAVLIELERGLSIRGRVEPAGGTDVAIEVAVELRPEQLRPGGGGGMFRLSGLAASAQAEPETGAFEIGPVEPGTYSLVARAADGRGGEVRVDVGPEGAEDVVLTLEQRATLRGHVQDRNGKLLGDVSVRARKRQNASISVVVNGRELTAQTSPSSIEGEFEIAGLAAGAWIVEVVDAQGEPLAIEGSPDGLIVELAKAQTRELELRVEARDGVIAGVVRDSEGHAVADAWVSAAFVPRSIDAGHDERDPDDPDDPDQGEPRSEMRMVMMVDDGGGLAATLPPVLTDEDGRFQFGGLRHGRYTLSAELDGGGARASVEDVQPDAEITLELAALGSITGRVSLNGQPAECAVSLAGPTPRRAGVRGGSFEVERLEPGTYTVEASAAQGSTQAQVVVAPGQSASVELALEAFATITGTLLDLDGKPIANAPILIGGGGMGRIEINHDDGDPIYASAEDGSFEVQAAAGQRVLVAESPDGPMPIIIKPFVATAGQALNLGPLRQREGGMMMQDEPGESAHPE